MGLSQWRNKCATNIGIQFAQVAMSKNFLLVFGLVVNTFFVPVSADESGFVSIFNGSDLKGWDAKPGAWEVRDGEIWCTGDSKGKNWLIWRGGEPANFVLRLEFRWDKGNSGVQVRSDDLGEHQVFGYQVEIAPSPRAWTWMYRIVNTTETSAATTRTASLS